MESLISFGAKLTEGSTDFKVDLKLLIQLIADRSKEKLIQQQNHPVIKVYGSSHFTASIEAKHLYVVSAALPSPPVVAKMRGEKEPCSTSWTRCSWARLLSHSRLEQRALLIRFSIWVKSFDIKVHPSTSHTPKSRSPTIQPGLLCGNSRTVPQTFPSQGLQFSLYCGIMTNFSQQGGSEVTEFVVSIRGHSTMRTAQSMFYCEV